MKTRFFFSLAAAAVFCFGSQSLNAQNPGLDVTGFGLGNPSGAPPNLTLGSSIVPASYDQAAPFGAPAAFIPASPALAPPSQVVPVGYQSECGGKGCSKGCSDCAKGGKGKGGSSHRWEFYGEFLYLRARDAEIAYAVPFNGPNNAAPPVDPRLEVGAVGVLDMDFQPSYRVGVNKLIDDCTRISAEYTMYESGTTDRTVRGPNAFAVHSLVSHPSTFNAASSTVQADGQYDISMDIIDIDVRRLFYNDVDLKLGWLLGVRAAQQEQQMQAVFTGNATETVTTDVDFNGVGLKFGIDGEMCLGGQWLGYASLGGSLIPGQFSTDFNQTTLPNVVAVDTSWEAGRIVTIWDLELGISRVSRCGNYRVNAGYMFSAWTNTVQTDEWIEAVHTNNFINMDSTMSFDGLVGRFEARF